MPQQSSLQPKPSSQNRQYAILEDAQVSQEAADKLSLLLQTIFDSIVSKSYTDMGRTNLFKMDILNVGPHIGHKPYPIPLKYQNFVGEEVWLLGSAGIILKCLSPWAGSSDSSFQKTRSFTSLQATTLLCKFINATCNGNKVI